MLRSSRELAGAKKLHYVLLLLLGCLLYAGSLGHEWALDDTAVYTENPAVQDGLSGVPRILTSDAYAHLYERMDRPAELSGGRYRPLSLITFALEHELFGNAPFVAHAGNILLYGLTLPLLFLLLRKWRPRRAGWALIATLLFAVHPIHTEVVANVKSRDEILSLLFLLAALYSVWRSFELRTGDAATAADRRGWPYLAASGLAAFLALLSKEYAVSLLLLAPAMLFVFGKAPLRIALRYTWPIGVAIAAYLALRISAVGIETVEAVDLLNDPYLLATPEQRWATKAAVLLSYLRLLIWPHPLSADYSYRQIPYRDFQDPLVWLSLLLGILILGATWIGLRRRHWIGFAALFYLVHLALVSNIFVEIGATMGERLVYHASVGFVMLLAGVLGASQWIAGALLVVWATLTVLRVPDWKNDVTLFTHDVRVVPESARVNANAGRGYLLLADEESDPESKDALLQRAREHLEKTIAIDSEIVMAYFTLGAVQDRLGQYEAMARSWEEARKRFPDHPLFSTYDPILADRLTRLAAEAAKEGDAARARAFLERAVEVEPEQASLWFNLGLGRRADGDTTGAIQAWEEALRLDPTLSPAAEALGRDRATDGPASSGAARSGK